MSAFEGLHRATFESPYLVSKAQRPLNSKSPRLGDHLLYCVEFGSRDYLQETCVGEFGVIDLANRQKAWFETPTSATSEQITAMIESHFDASAFQVDIRLWVVEC